MDLASLVDLLARGPVVALTGAGCSTESGIPDYRGPETARRARNPIQFRQFVEGPGGRARYWARSLVGWPRIESARPNDGHRALAELEAAGLLRGVITQNVDRLHQAAGSERVIELHGALADVRCLGCGALERRSSLQQRLLRLNPDRELVPVEAAPDGDAELDDTEGFVVAACLHCGGVLKPDVVFFGENVPRHRVDAAWALLDEAATLLVVGSSLTVFSGYRFVRRAHQRGQPVGIVNLGPTRGDPLAAVRVDGAAGEVLPALAETLISRAAGRAAG